MTPRRVAFVLPSFAGGGSERVLLTLLAGLDRDRFAPTLIVLHNDGPLAGLVPDDVTVHDLARPRLRHALPALARTIRSLAPVTVISSLGYLNLGLLALRPLLPTTTRLVAREANTPSQSLPRSRWPLATWFGYRLLYPTADAVLCQHDRTAAEMRARFEVPESRIRRLDNPVDVAGLRAKATPRREPGPGPRFVAAGRLTRQKGFDRLLPMITRLPAAHLTILGDGPDRAALERQARSLGVEDRVRLAGFEPNPWAWYAGADACLVPSRWEGMPNVALEALALGAPVIAMAEAGGIAELAARSDAVTVADDSAAFEAAMAAVTPAPVDAPRRSRLPTAYEAARVVAEFEHIIGGL